MTPSCCCVVTAQAKRRGLPVLTTTADSLPVLTAPKNVELLSSLGVFSKEELESRQNILTQEYITKVCESALRPHTCAAPPLPRFCTCVEM